MSFMQYWDMLGSIRDSTQTLPKTIVGGTEQYIYADARGSISRAPGGPHVITLFNWYH